MRDRLPVRLLTPEGIFFEGEALYALVETASGPIGIYPNHDTYLGSLRKGGKVTLAMGDHEVSYLSSGGMLLVDPDGLTLDSPSFRPLS